jgi:hypothetical protein
MKPKTAKTAILQLQICNISVNLVVFRSVSFHSTEKNNRFMMAGFSEFGYKKAGKAKICGIK